MFCEGDTNVDGWLMKMVGRGENGWNVFFFVVSTITYRGRICTQCRPKALYLIGMDGGQPQP